MPSLVQWVIAWLGNWSYLLPHMAPVSQSTQVSLVKDVVLSLNYFYMSNICAIYLLMAKDMGKLCLKYGTFFVTMKNYHRSHRL